MEIGPPAMTERLLIIGGGGKGGPRDRSTKAKILGRQIKQPFHSMALANKNELHDLQQTRK